MDKADLERVFRRKFEATNDNLRTYCPFHDESKPSFFVHSSDLLAYCFGCGVGGSVDVLAARYLNVSQKDARKLLDITVDDALYGARRSRERKKIQPTKYYPESWLAPWKREVHRYVKERGFSIATIQTAQGLYDYASNRQVFPHRDRRGRLLGATGRACGGQEPKWYHYWGYDKSQALYSPFDIDPLRPTIVVEGVFDLLWLHQNGVNNVVGLLGSKFSLRQVHQLAAGTAEAILGLDNDDAGQYGTAQARRMLQRDIRLRYIEWPVGAHDWMDLSKEQIQDVLTNAQTHVQRSIIRYTNASSRATVQQKEGSTELGAGHRKDRDSSSGSGEALRARPNQERTSTSAKLTSVPMGRSN